MRQNGGPAFPHSKYMKNPATGSFDTYAHGGMSLRDYLAGQSLTGLISASGSYGMGNGPGDLAVRAYEIADAMLEARDA